ncbi:MAG: polymer-forming cytoskeletal protein [Bacteroidota bacterium]
MAKTNEIDSSSINILGAGTSVKGDITSNGDFRIDGSLIGNITAKGKLVIGATGAVEGEICCQNADFSGSIKGKVNVSELLSLKSTCRVMGDIIINKLSIEPGAQFSGSCNMDSSKNTTLYTNKSETEKS